MAIQGTDIADLVTTSLNELGRLKMTDLMSDYQDTVALKRLMRDKKITFDSGPEVSFNIITATGTNARFVGLGEEDVVDMSTVMTTGKVPWRHMFWAWAIERREIAMNRSPSKIVDLAKTRRYAEFGAAIILMEQAFWRCPGTADTTTPYGIPYFVVKSNTAVTTNDGFNGGAPTGSDGTSHTLCANVSSTTYRRWSNYATQYTTVSKDDLIRKMRRMSVYTRFKPLVKDVPTYNTGNDMGFYTNYSVVGTMEEILEAQNESLGSDVAPKDGQVMFKRAPVEFVKELDLDTTNPVYSINWGEMFTMGLRGEWMNETVEAHRPGQHTVAATLTDCSYNLHCRDRRRHGVLATTTGVSY